MSKPKPKRKYAACGACRGKGLVWVNQQGQRITPGAAAEYAAGTAGISVRYCTCELGEAKRLAAARDAARDAAWAAARAAARDAARADARRKFAEICEQAFEGRKHEGRRK